MKIRNYWKKHRVLSLALISLIIMAFTAHFLYQKLATPKVDTVSAIQVQTVRVKEASMPTLLETIGIFSAEKEVKLKSTGAGKIVKLFVEGGSWVKEGTLLLSLIGGPELRAPFDGYLTDWQIKVGEFVSTGTELVDIVNTDTLLLNYRVPESYAGQLDTDQRVEVSVRSFPETLFQGVVKFISPIVDKKTFTILVKAEVENLKQNLWPGMSAHVRHILNVVPKALIVPESSLILTLEGYELLVVSEGKLVRRSLKLGSRSQGRVHVLSGVSLGESVLLTRTDSTKEGAVVVANDWAGDW